MVYSYNDMLNNRWRTKDEERGQSKLVRLLYELDNYPWNEFEEKFIQNLLGKKYLKLSRAQRDIVEYLIEKITPK